MNIKNKKLIFVTTLLFSFSILGILPTLAHAKPLDEWVCASSYDIIIGDHYSGTISDTYTNNGYYLVGACFYTGFWIFSANAYEIKFDFGNSHYKQVVIEAKTDYLGTSGIFILYAYYTTGNRVYLGEVDKDTIVYKSLDYTRVLDKIGLEYWQDGVPGQRAVGVDLIKALWTYYT